MCRVPVWMINRRLRDSSAVTEFFYFFFVVVVVCSDKNSYSSNILCGTLEVLHRAVEIPHKDVSRQSVGSEVLAILTVLQEVFHRHG